MFFLGRAKTIPHVPVELRESVIMAIRIMEGNNGLNVDLVGAHPGNEAGCMDIKYRTKAFRDVEEVERIRKEITTWMKENPENLKKGLEFIQKALEPIMKMAQKAGFDSKASI